MRVNFYWQNYKYFPYEKLLASRELLSLTGNDPQNIQNGLSVEIESSWDVLIHRTTYFHSASLEDGTTIIPLQAQLEASTNEHSDTTSVKRQSTRYSAHGIHDYRGKFNPQIVRAIGNILNLQQGNWILDPFCGSGTSLLEALHSGWNALGIDINPLAVQIANAKIAMLRVPKIKLEDAVSFLEKQLRIRAKDIHLSLTNIKEETIVTGSSDWEQFLPGFEYLKEWFTCEVLVQLAVILEIIAEVSSTQIQLVFKIILSDIVREVSLQEPSDLRIRRRKTYSSNIDVITIFLNALKNKIKTVLKGRQYLLDGQTFQRAVCQDIRDFIGESSNLYDAVITSPPYATGLPYIDTDRLSLVLLGLITSKKIHSTQKSLIGNREITNIERQELEDRIKTNADNLPLECVYFCQTLLQAVDKAKDGFRRQNVPALIYKYLADAAFAFQRIHPLLKKDAPFALVVGRNSTTLGGKKFTIDTPYLLSLLAIQNGFRFQEAIELDTYQRFDVHKANSINSESLTILRAG